MNGKTLVGVLAVLATGTVCAASHVRGVHVSHVGYLPDAPKRFYVRNPPAKTFEVHTIDPSVSWKKVYAGELRPCAGEEGVWEGDFTAVRKPADYRIVVTSEKTVQMNCWRLPADDEKTVWSQYFTVQDDIYDVAQRMTLTFFRWQRCGSTKGWAHVCHQDPVTLYGTDRKVDLRGGYHQSGDLRGWCEGISMSLYGLLRWAEAKKPVWDSGEVDEELRWGVDYFLKLAGPENYCYDSQFVPIGWGPRDYYPQPAPFPGQCNVVMLLSRAARRFQASDPAYAARCVATARRMLPDLETNPIYDKPYRPMVEKLPAGTQGTNFWWQSYRASTTSKAALAMAMLEFYRTTGETLWRDKAKKLGREVVALQIAEGPLAGAYRLEPGRDEFAFGDCSYGWAINGWRLPCEFDLAFPDEPEWKRAALASCGLFVRLWRAVGGAASPSLRSAARAGGKGKAFAERPFAAAVLAGDAATTVLYRSILLFEAAHRYGCADYRAPAQEMLDFVLGANDFDTCCVTGLGHNEESANVWGQFFPSTPPIPGGFAHVLRGEYDMPPAGLFIWATAEAAAPQKALDGGGRTITVDGRTEVHGEGFFRTAETKWSVVPMNPAADGTDAFHAKRRDLWRAPDGRDLKTDSPLDYALREVRDRMVRRVSEAAEREDVNGIELDWTCTGHQLAQGRERIDAHCLTDFIRAVRRNLDRIAAKRKKPILLACRVPGDAKCAKALGLDVADWLRNRYIDLVLPPADGVRMPKGAPRNVPELMKTAEGRPVTDRATWENVRKGEIRETFLREVYGRRPAEKPARLSFSAAEPDRVMMGGKAVRKMIRISYGDRGGDASFVATAFIPTAASAAKPAPAFLLICNRDPKENLDPERVVKSGFWPAEQIVARGYAAIAFFNGDVTKDVCWDFANGVFGVFQNPAERTPESWGVLSAWAWGASRVMDWIETEGTLDAKRVGVVGHSRCGKTSLFAGVTDERFALTCVNCSGCGGAKLNHMELPLSEHYDQIWGALGCWFCGNFEKYLYREHEAPFDAHEWAALIAPRLLAIASASEDDWAGQEGEFQTARLASPAWELYGKKGLVGDAFPGADKPLQEGSVSYHMRTGEHDLTPYDWDRYMDFADRNWGRP